MIVIEQPSPEDRETFDQLLGMSLEMVGEMALVPVSPEKVAAKIYQPIVDGLCWVARDGKRIVGVIALKEAEFDYADGTFWEDSFFYVDRNERFGAIGVRLLRKVREAAAEAGKICLIARVREDRRRSTFGIYSEIAGFTPFGHVARVA